MSNYDSAVSNAKAAVTRHLMGTVSGDPETQRCAIDQLASAIDDLNKAWDNLTDCLVRQRDERDRQISRLMSDLAEARRR